MARANRANREVWGGMRSREQGVTVWPGMLPGRAGGNVRNGGLVESGNRRIGGPGNRENGGGAESRRKKHGEPGRVPSHGRHGGCGWGYLRGRMATMRVPPVYPESMYISPCRWVTIRRQR